ncbi:ABC transporter ATP-binding protein [Corynebacterium aquatimens]|uniref:Iron complex transport system ATP-binding protein n=1 Tax=Corynebacterium aquatimens TaxID=1190508 RepID=A0A931GR61_9CORY|nr:ABC transporter ATP-binding protein [Corynebacterium aquatimens]MBG6121603.1 iron complex transport system ATP-binding protein [Corynebacterium aquatimens]WJY65857.1 putative siderophore transport system ATP-binding protein YusV [Corynebacterium aquatimens]
MRQKATASLQGRGLRAGYGSRVIIEHAEVAIPNGEFTVIVGPNACGKSTLLKTLARVIPPLAGEVLLNEQPITSIKPKAVARQLSFLPQSPLTPDGITVKDLVSRGRYPYQGLLRQWSDGDEVAVEEAMARAGVAALSERFVSELSGGQRQRVWIALVLAQQTPIVLLDEPTTYLDITHQVEVLDLARNMQRSGHTVVAVLHDLTLAFRYATHLLVMKKGEIVAEGPVADVVTPQLIEHVYGLACTIITDPETGRPIVVPKETARTVQ